jgi:GNAT superfamily N-acetyltransferase
MDKLITKRIYNRLLDQGNKYYKLSYFSNEEVIASLLYCNITLEEVFHKYQIFSSEIIQTSDFNKIIKHSNTVLIFNVYTHPDYRNQGIQSTLFEHLLSEPDNNYWLSIEPYKDQAKNFSQSYFNILNNFYRNFGFYYNQYLKKPTYRWKS